MKIHFIAVGGSAMHNLALALKDEGHVVTGSDDEIYEPSRSRLEKAGILPKKMGWDIDRITKDLDAIIVGMHARIDNPELIWAQEMGLKIYSYPEFVAEASKDKKRIVIAGSHGKTTTTSIIMNALDYNDYDYDFLVGAQLEGFDRMVKISDAELIILEGDEYLSSPIDRRPKMMHYHPHISVITGIAWDHINVFPTEEDYNRQFSLYLDTIVAGGKLFFYERDEVLTDIVLNSDADIDAFGYSQIILDRDHEHHLNEKTYPIKLIGDHNLQNIKAAELVCLELGLTKDHFYNSLASFKGAAKRLQHIKEGKNDKGHVYLDFAHAPSKVKATTEAVKSTYPETKLIAILELHTFSSLNKEFLPTYKGTLDDADEVIVYYDPHTLAMKNMPELEESFVKKVFGKEDLTVITSPEILAEAIDKIDISDINLLLMSSGKFGGVGIPWLKR